MLQICMQDLLAMLPQPVIALLLLFPITDDSEAASKAGKRQIQFSNIAPFCHVIISSHGYLTLRRCLSTCALAISSRDSGHVCLSLTTSLLPRFYRRG